MKTTITIHLGGRIFQITEEAYNQLNDYLNSLSTCFRNNEYGEEIVTDIESRISELCDERVNSTGIIELGLVNEIINRIGAPEIMIENEGDNEEENCEKEKKKETAERGRIDKKFFLDPEDRMLGGVVSGLAAYTKIDVTLLRIASIIVLFTTGYIGIIGYIAVWAIAPTAHTTADKLRMQGVEPTPENIAEKITTAEPSGEAEMKPREKSHITTFVLIAMIAVATIVYIHSENGMALLMLVGAALFGVGYFGVKAAKDMAQTPKLILTLAAIFIPLLLFFATFFIMYTTIKP